MARLMRRLTQTHCFPELTSAARSPQNWSTTLAVPTGRSAVLLWMMWRASSTLLAAGYSLVLGTSCLPSRCFWCFVRHILVSACMLQLSIAIQTLHNAVHLESEPLACCPLTCHNLPQVCLFSQRLISRSQGHGFILCKQPAEVDLLLFAS